ncbi:MAG: HAMP domain-containing histidine kinase [Acidobacteria bacterium]|nr:HAMP domain-containing histidine kinase [Acidobacteriota bacterium]
MNRLRNRLILVFLAATLAPLGVTLWVTTSLLDHSLNIAAARERELDKVSLSLQTAGRAFYQKACAHLKSEALARRIEPTRYAEADIPRGPSAVRELWESNAEEQFSLSGQEGDRLDYLVRRGQEVWSYSSDLGGVAMQRLREEYRRARESVEEGRARNLRRGFTYAYIVLAAAIWSVSFALLVYLAHRVSRPIQQLTAGLGELAKGNLAARVTAARDDEVGQAIQAFNRTAAELQHNRDRLVYLTQMASWQLLARKMAHEVKNSLTPIRLTVEEMVARHAEADPAFLQQAAQIVVDEVESLERRVRAFSEFAAEPPVRPAPLAVNGLVDERVAFLRTGHPEVAYSVRLAEGLPRALADEDLVKGILTNLLENAAEAAGSGGRILVLTTTSESGLAIEVHDSGPGLSEEVRRSLFQPTISFKKRGMGLGLSIARKSALLMGGDIVATNGALGGAGFRIQLPPAPDA